MQASGPTMRLQRGLKQIATIPATSASNSPVPSSQTSAQLFPAPSHPNDSPALTALYPEPKYSDELFEFERYPPLERLDAHHLQELKDTLCEKRMLVDSPSPKAWKSMELECYEQYAIYVTYSLF